MLRWKTIGAWLASAVLVLSLVGCNVQKQGDLLSDIKERGSIRIGTEGTYKPFSFHDEKTGELTGFDVEVAEEVAKRLGVKAEFVETPWDSMLTSLQTKKIDMVANQVGIKPERKEKFDFSKPYTVSYAQIVVKSDSTSISDIQDVKGKKAGQTPTSNFGEMARQAGAEIVAYEDMMSAMRDVAAGRIDFSINDRLAIAEMMKVSKLPLKTVGEPMDRSESAFPVPKGNAELIAEINKALDSMRQDGTLAKISMKWFGEDVTK
ncbi:transporter substrate-binding domain-containing protein [Staphylospora marina]|uniref:transporter substrate-binding domain-containing protein n=1 Tax=Staphylospora marina TaxID=2490858 RepID=UPI000F5BF030|nr:transporter substrate-binding domain-containing protein [Staphylospora marina]